MMLKATTGPSGQAYVEADDVFDLLFDDAADAAEARARATLVEYLRDAVSGWTQAEAAARLRTTQPRVSALVRGKVEAFSLSALVKYVTRLGAQPVVTIREDSPLQAPADHDAYLWTGVEGVADTGDTWTANTNAGIWTEATTVAFTDTEDAVASGYSFQLAA